jgi:hypothetical protein
MSEAQRELDRRLEVIMARLHRDPTLRAELARLDRPKRTADAASHDARWPCFSAAITPGPLGCLNQEEGPWRTGTRRPSRSPV